MNAILRNLTIRFKLIRPSTVTKLPAVMLCLSITILSGSSCCLAQSSDYRPGESIKFHDSSPLPAPSSSPQDLNTSSGQSAPLSSATASGERGLGSFLKKVVRQELQNGTSNAPAYSNTSPYSSYSGVSQQYAAASSYTQSGGNSINSNPTSSNAIYQSRYRQAVTAAPPNPNYNAGQAAYGMNQPPRITGNVLDFVTSDPPIPLSGDVENLIPAELHRKAYGIELHRVGPLNGAQDNDHLY